MEEHSNRQHDRANGEPTFRILPTGPESAHQDEPCNQRQPLNQILGAFLYTTNLEERIIKTSIQSTHHAPLDPENALELQGGGHRFPVYLGMISREGIAVRVQEVHEYPPIRAHFELGTLWYTKSTIHLHH